MLVYTIISLVLPPELDHEVIHHVVVKVFSTEVSVTSSGLDPEDRAIIGDAQHRHLKGSSPHVKRSARCSLRPSSSCPVYMPEQLKWVC